MCTSRLENACFEDFLRFYVEYFGAFRSHCDAQVHHNIKFLHDTVRNFCFFVVALREHDKLTCDFY